MKYELHDLANNILNVFGLKVSKINPPNDFSFLNDYNINTIFDIGANVGEFSIEIADCFPNAQIYSFEPLKEEYAQLVQNLKFKLKNPHTFNIALGDFNGYSKIYKAYGDSGVSSILKMKYDKTNNRTSYLVDSIQEEEIEVRRLDDFITEENIGFETEILIKLDVQGYELEVMKGGGNVFSLARLLIVETNFTEMYEDQVLFDQLYSELKKLGFKYIGQVASSSPTLMIQSGLQIEVDCVFLKQ